MGRNNGGTWGVGPAVGGLTFTHQLRAISKDTTQRAKKP